MNDSIATMYASGMSCATIAVVLNCNDETVRLRLIKLGIKRRPKTYRKPRPIPSWEEYFSSKIKRSGECLLWTGFRDQTGYGRTDQSFAPDIHFAHRLSWFLSHGAFDLKLRVLHKCDTPSCVNPDHLWLGTQVDNIKDMCAKGRQRGISRFGEESPVAKLDNESVRKMRVIRAKQHTPFHKLAAQFGVSTMTAYRAVTGQSWSKLDD